MGNVANMPINFEFMEFDGVYIIYTTFKAGCFFYCIFYRISVM